MSSFDPGLNRNAFLKLRERLAAGAGRGLTTFGATWWSNGNVVIRLAFEPKNLERFGRPDRFLGFLAQGSTSKRVGRGRSSLARVQLGARNFDPEKIEAIERAFPGCEWREQTEPSEHFRDPVTRRDTRSTAVFAYRDGHVVAAVAPLVVGDHDRRAA